ncbi:MAG: 2-oxo acid dehydrogenase subunit E2 [Deltaproteobacteria bacterium]|nr:2-oxo acid dehydrogenase subunit E2 [Deltaproteobacteria bacterium]
MATNVTMPKLGLTMETGKIVEWKAAQGGEVQQGSILLVVETEKITYEVEAPASGLLNIIVKAEEEVPVAALIAQIAADKAELDSLAAGGAPAAAAPAPAAAAPAAAAPAQAAAPAAAAPSRAPGERVKASPLAKKLAEEADIDISLIAGTGPEGRIVKEDVENYLASNKVRISPVAKKMADEAGLALISIAGTGVNGKIMKEDVEKAIAAAKQAPAAAAAPEKKAAEAPAMASGDRMEKLTSMRKVIARKMLQSCNEAAMAYMTYEIDATAIQDFREKILKSAEKKHGVRVTITDFMLKLTAMALRQHPVINTRWVEGQGILFLDEINVGMAMAIKTGLVVPVIKTTDKKTIIEIAKDRTALIDKGRGGKLGPNEMTGGTFTVSAMGMFGTDVFTAIINQPENAILGVGTIKDKPVVVNGQIVIRPMMNLSLTYDHRTIDGADAGRFMQTLKEFMEDPMMTLA